MPKLSVNFKELDAFDRKLKQLADEAEGVCKMALYDGAAVAADALRKSVDGLHRVPDVVAMNAARRGEPTFLSVSQKNGLRAGLGVARMKVSGKLIHVKVGFDGYNAIRTKRWPNGQPNQMVAGSCESGSSAMIEQPFIRTTFKANSAQMQRAMVKTATEKITEILDK